MKVFFFIFVFVKLNVFAQVNIDKYRLMTASADSLYKSGDYLESAKIYSQAFSVSLAAHGKDRYRAAKAWGKASVKDSCFYHLERYLKNFSISDLNMLKSEEAFFSYHSEPKWMEIVELVKTFKVEKEKKYNWKLIVELDTIYVNDTKYRKLLKDLNAERAPSYIVDSLWRLINHQDSLNFIKVSSILDNYGWLCSDIIGEQGNLTLFLVVQHSDLKGREKYLPMMTEAAERKCATKGDVASVIDRILLEKRQKQIYGTQVGYDKAENQYFIAPVEFPEGLNERRKKMNIVEMNEYLRYWKIKWDPNVYILKKDYYEKIYFEGYK